MTKNTRYEREIGVDSTARTTSRIEEVANLFAFFADLSKRYDKADVNHFVIRIMSGKHGSATEWVYNRLCSLAEPVVDKYDVGEENKADTREKVWNLEFTSCSKVCFRWEETITDMSQSSLWVWVERIENG